MALQPFAAVLLMKSLTEVVAEHGSHTKLQGSEALYVELANEITHFSFQLPQDKGTSEKLRHLNRVLATVVTDKRVCAML
eukprot:CAMPEP_0171559746 /NCGR_PEP_ID=MMETSP0960-20121227/13067_1 /TAXON_ID=87120 /ORGANISM="Aurantiochytrium limacinum, Strain ATCCMYA-1381" /LENGTH=79 /DNA_ID=CAMNT_0012111379 /DNA_START=154 /DNA_END=393 /DNA_ORIENTATION=+